MRKLFIIILFALVATKALASGGLQQFDLVIPNSFKTEEYKTDLQSWRASLLKGVGYDDNEIEEAIFLKTDIPLKVNAHESIGQVYQNKDVKHQFYILASNTIIDFVAKKVGTMGVSGISSHPTPSKRMVIVLAPDKNINLLGVTLGFTTKVQVKRPKFTANSVIYEWRAW